jgi:hypothetical protein
MNEETSAATEVFCYCKQCGLKPCLSLWKSYGLVLPALKGLPQSELGIHMCPSGYPDAPAGTNASSGSNLAVK